MIAKQAHNDPKLQSKIGLKTSAAGNPEDVFISVIKEKALTMTPPP
jgi:hypothetical protein